MSRLVFLLFSLSLFGQIDLDNDFEPEVRVSSNEKYIFELKREGSKSKGTLYQIILVNKDLVNANKLWDKILPNKVRPEVLLVSNNGSVVTLCEPGENTIVIYNNQGRLTRRWYFTDITKLSKSVSKDSWSKKQYKIKGEEVTILLGTEKLILELGNQPKLKVGKK